MAETVGRGNGSDGFHRSVLEAGVERAGGGVRGGVPTDAGQRPALQAGAWAQDRSKGRGMAGGVGATWAGTEQFCAAQGDAGVARPDARPGDADGRPHGGGQPFAEAAGRSQHQAVECGQQYVGGIGPADLEGVGEGQSRCRGVGGTGPAAAAREDPAIAGSLGGTDERASTANAQRLPHSARVSGTASRGTGRSHRSTSDRYGTDQTGRVAEIGRMSAHQQQMLNDYLTQLEFLEQQVEELDGRIEAHLIATGQIKQVELLDTIPGVNLVVGATMVAELGVDMKQFPDADHACSWAGMCPGNHISAGKRYSGRTNKGNVWLRRALCQASWAAGKSKKTYLSEQYRRWKGRRGKKRGIVALGHQILEIAYTMLKTGTAYHEWKPAERQTKERRSAKSRGRNWQADINRSIEVLHSLGYQVTAPSGLRRPPLLR